MYICIYKYIHTCVCVYVRARTYSGSQERRVVTKRDPLWTRGRERVPTNPHWARVVAYGPFPPYDATRASTRLCRLGKTYVQQRVLGKEHYLHASLPGLHETMECRWHTDLEACWRYLNSCLQVYEARQIYEIKQWLRSPSTKDISYGSELRVSLVFSLRYSKSEWVNKRVRVCAWNINNWYRREKKILALPWHRRRRKLAKVGVELFVWGRLCGNRWKLLKKKKKKKHYASHIH